MYKKFFSIFIISIFFIGCDNAKIFPINENIVKLTDNKELNYRIKAIEQNINKELKKRYDENACNLYFDLYEKYYKKYKNIKITEDIIIVDEMFSFNKNCKFEFINYEKNINLFTNIIKNQKDEEINKEKKDLIIQNYFINNFSDELNFLIERDKNNNIEEQKKWN